MHAGTALALWLETRRKEGSTLSTHFGYPTVQTFGQPDLEYEHLTQTVGCLVHSDRGIIEVRGERASHMVNGLVTNDLADLNRGKAVYAFVLTPKGRPVAEVQVLPYAETVRLDTPAACLSALLDHLRHYIPPLYARVALLPEVVKLSVIGPRAAEAADLLRNQVPWAETLPAWDSLDPLLTLPLSQDFLLVRQEAIMGPGFDLYIQAEDLELVWQLIRRITVNCGGGAVGLRAHEIWRVEHGIPAYGPDITVENLPQETGQESRAISYDKGCYTGQEVVARIHYRGHVNRQLRGLSFSGSAIQEGCAPQPGQALYQNGREVGQVTTPVQSPRFGLIALGYVRSKISPGEVLSLDPTADPVARVQPLPFTLP